MLRIVSPLPGDEPFAALSSATVTSTAWKIVIPLGTEVAGKVTVVDANGQRLPIHPNVSVNFRVSNDELQLDVRARRRDLSDTSG